MIAGRRVDLEALDVDRHGAELWASIGRHVALWEEIPSGPFADREAFVAWANDRTTREGTYLYAVRSKESGRVVGLYFLLHVDAANGVAEIGLVYGSELQRTAAGTEAFFLLADSVLGTLRYRRLEWRCSPAHVASRAAAKRYGFREEGILRRTMWAKGRSWDTLCTSILDDEWPALATRFRAWLEPSNFDPEGKQRRALASF
ncbi:MAG TPA: GNAT family protein [Polyangiaceae bacterium]